MVEQGRKPWDRMDDESSAAYARFLVYRNLGPSRSVDKAYKSIAPKRVKSRRASGQWDSDSAQYNWEERAHAWDIENLTEVGQRVVVKFVDVLELAAQQLLESILSGRIKPKTWAEVTQAINVLGNFVPAETVQKIRDIANSDGVPPVGAPDGKRE